MKYYEIDELKQKTIKLLMNYSLDMEQAQCIAQCFITADACSVKTHGLAVLPAHIKKLSAGAYNINPNFKIVKSTNAFAVIDSDNAIGPYSASYCMNFAMEKAKKEGIFTIFSKNCNTYGPAFYYTYLAVKQGLIGVTFCNSPVAMAPWGGKEKLLGTNPLAVGIPGKSEGPILYDIATSKVAKSKINKARLENKQIPLDWALDLSGNPTTDPLEAIKGAVLPMAGHKGYGLSLVLDMLSGMISGAAFSTGVNKFYSENDVCMNVGQTFIAIDPKVVMDEEFYDLTDEYINKIHSSDSACEERVIFPGEHKLESMKKAIIEGINYGENIESALESLFCEIGD